MNTKELTTEFFGSFVFYAIVISQKNTEVSPILCGIALIIGILIAKIGSERAGALNPSVSLMSYLNGSINETDAVYFIVIQIVAAVCAYNFNKLLKHEKK